MREIPINDFMTHDGKLRIDGRVERDMYLFKVKTPEETKGPNDLYKLIARIPGDQATRPLGEGGCPAIESLTERPRLILRETGTQAPDGGLNWTEFS
jgi:branched-chain amino acid transport system substrate-binding protein